MHPTLQWLTKNVAESLGQIFLRVIFMVVVPLVFSALTLAIAGIGNVRKVGRLGLKMLLMTLILTSASVAIGLTLANAVRPGDRLDDAQRQQLKEQYGSSTQKAVERVARLVGDTHAQDHTANGQEKLRV